MSKTANIIFISLIALLLFGIGAGFLLVKKYSSNLPSYDQLKSYSPSVTTRLYSSDGRLLTEYSKEKRIFVPIKAIPQHLIDAFLAAEDSNFYKHSGIDPIAIVRAAIKNFFSVITNDQISGGASTITQQVVKNFLLTNEKTLQRKIKEAILAFKMTSVFSKDEILELYLNQIYLGSGAYGVAAAAQVYFDKSIDELSVEEMALLATLPKAPSKLDPRKNIEKAKVRRDWVINRMIDEQFISREDGDKAIEKPIVLKEKGDDEIVKADFFSDAVKKELTSLYGSDNVFESGIVVRTSLNPDLQKYAAIALQTGIENYDMKHGYRGALTKIKDVSSLNWTEKLRDFQVKEIHREDWYKAIVLGINNNVANIGVEGGDIGTIDLSNLKWARKHIGTNSLGPSVKKISDVLNVGDVIMVKEVEGSTGKYHLRQIPTVNGAFLAMDPHSGRVLAMMGGYVDAVNQFNRATQAQRQPGSVMKTFGYIAALENGMTPATIIVDEPVTLNQGGSLPPYKPTNYSNEFYGPITLRTGLENSINVTTVKVAEQVGLDKVSEVISRFGVNANPPAIYSSVLGSIESSLINVVGAYSTIVNGGKKVNPSLIEKIQDRNGKTIYKRDQRDCISCTVSPDDSGKIVVPYLPDDRPVITDSATAYQITSMLEGVVQRGTSVRAKSIGKIVGGKTGTTNNYIDSWFVGFSPDLVAGVYIGFDTPKTLGSGETGASIALPVFIDFMKQALKDVPSTPFRVPGDVKFVKIDRTTGALATPSTPKSNIIFEAFKLDDVVEEDSKIVPEENELNESEEENSDNMGIY
ncbi:MAG: mrcA [Rickettsiaceae bacterium]|jgi:penicillin-binding protein 1A|nr:mrcA [Rickettsiaceae bacterium]